MEYELIKNLANEELHGIFDFVREEYERRLVSLWGLGEDDYWISKDGIFYTLYVDDEVVSLDMDECILVVEAGMKFGDFYTWFKQWYDTAAKQRINLRSWIMGARPEMFDKKISFKEDKEDKKEKVYISLPIAHYDLQERIAYAESIEKMLEGKGYQPVNPFDNGLTEKDPIEDHMRADFKMLLECDYIYLCDGWGKSRGCLAEFNMATACGIVPIYDTTEREL